MKPLTLLFVCLLVLASATATAQENASHGSSPGPPGVVLLKFKWAREIQFPRGWDRAPYDASVGTGQSFPPNRQREAAPSSPFPRSGRLPYVYRYTAKIRNDGAKEIKGIVWEYVLNDPGSKKELGRHQFYSYEKISGREQATLRGKSTAAPSKVVTVQGLEKDGRSPFDESVEIRCVMYADGTWWIHPSAGEFECFNLKRRERFYKNRGAR